MFQNHEICMLILIKLVLFFDLHAFYNILMTSTQNQRRYDVDYLNN